jgi:hypothetical protein
VGRSSRSVGCVGSIPSPFRRRSAATPRLETVEWLGGDGDEHRFAFEWRLQDAGLLGAVDAAEGCVLEATGVTGE